MSSPSPFLALTEATKTVACAFQLVGGVSGVVAAILATNIFIISPILLSNHSAFGTFAGENGKIAFTSTRDGNREIYAMNAADGSGQG